MDANANRQQRQHLLLMCCNKRPVWPKDPESGGTLASPYLPPLPRRPVQMQPCMSNGGGSILQISRLISLARFGQSVSMDDGQAPGAEDAVTVAEPRWPPPIQNAAAAVVAAGDYAKVQRTAGLRPQQLESIT